MKNFIRICAPLFFFFFSLTLSAKNLWVKTENWAWKNLRQWQEFVSLKDKELSNPIEKLEIQIRPERAKFANKFIRGKKQDEKQDECFCTLTDRVGLSIKARDTDTFQNLLGFLKQFENLEYQTSIWERETSIPNAWKRYQWNKRSNKTQHEIHSFYNWPKDFIQIEDFYETQVVLNSSPSENTVFLEIKADSHLFLAYVLEAIREQLYFQSVETTKAFSEAYAPVKQLLPLSLSRSNEMRKNITVPLDFYKKVCRDNNWTCFEDATPTRTIPTATPTARTPEQAAFDYVIMPVVGIFSFAVIASVGFYVYMNQKTEAQIYGFVD